MQKILFSLVAFLFIQSATYAQDRKEKLDKFLGAFGKYEKMMGSVAIMQDGELVYQGANGFASIKEEQKNLPDTKFRIGSISKMFTTVMIFQLIEEGKLSLDVKLSQFYPEIQNADKITISHLLRHRSGLKSFTDDTEYLKYMTKPQSTDKMIEVIKTLGTEFEPDEKGKYSNTNFYLLGHIIEKLTKETYAKQLQSRIAQKLKLENTYYGKSIDTASGEAYSFSKTGKNEWSLEYETDMSIPHGAGAVVSTAPDLATFITGLFNEKLISAASLESMKEIKDNYGRGLFEIPFYERKAFGHSGAIDAFLSSLAYFPESKTAVVILTNGLDGFTLNDVTIGVLSLWFNKPYQMPNLTEVAVELKVKELEKCTGKFSSTQIPLKMTVFIKDGQLMAQATGQGAFPLTAFSNTEFKFSDAGISMVFSEDTSKFQGFVLKQGGGEYQFKRVEE